jgi:hypothetical protein
MDKQKDERETQDKKHQRENENRIMNYTIREELAIHGWMDGS